MRQLTTTILAVTLLGLVALGGAGCGPADDAAASTGESDGAEPAANAEAGADAQDASDEEGDQEEAVPVEVVRLERGPMESILRLSSNLEAEASIGVFSQAKRRVTRLNVEEGDDVQKGAVLVELEDDEQRSALAKVRARLDKAEREYERQKSLYEQELISEQAWNDSSFEVDQLRIELADAERELGYTEVRAPIGGTITRRLVNLGDTVQVGQHLFDIVDFDSIVALVFVPEKSLALLRPGLPARIVMASGTDATHPARIERIAPIVDPQTGTVKVTVDVGRHPGLRPGMYVDVDLVVDTRDDALLVPKRALVYDDEQMFVYRLTEDGRVSRVFFQPRLTDKHHVEPASGLEPGDRVVVAGQAGLKDGALVSVAGAEPAATLRADDDEGQAGTTERAAL